MKQWLPSLLLVAMILWIVSAFLLHPGVPMTHDGENHVVRMANFLSALKEGQFPPRFAPHLFQGYGYPVFNYNYPLANILAIPFAAVGFSYPLTYKLILTAFLITGSAGWWLWLKVLKQQNKTILFTILFWLFSPYILSAWFVRGSIGEIATLALFPLVGFVVWHIGRTTYTVPIWLSSIIFAAFLLSHNVAVLLLTPILFLLWLTQAHSQQTPLKREHFIYLTTTSLLSLSLVTWFWLPALLEKSFIVLDGASLSTSANKHAVTLGQLLWSPIQQGFSFVGTVDTQSFQIGLPALIFTVALILLSLFKKQKSLTTMFALFLLSVSVLAQLKGITHYWSSLPFISFIQFPWRLGLITTSVATLLVGLHVDELPKWLKSLLVITLLLYAVGATRMIPSIQWIDQPDIYYLQFPQTTSTANENLPNTFTLNTVPSWSPQPTIATGSAQINTHSWTGRVHTYEVIVQEPSLIVEPTLVFPGWQTTISSLGLAHTKNTVLNAGSYEYKLSGGLIAYKLQPGSYAVKTEFTQNTPARLLGNGISLLGLGITTVLGIIFFYTWGRERIYATRSKATF